MNESKIRKMGVGLTVLVSLIVTLVSVYGTVTAKSAYVSLTEQLANPPSILNANGILMLETLRMVDFALICFLSMFTLTGAAVFIASLFGLWRTTRQN